MTPARSLRSASSHGVAARFARFARALAVASVGSPCVAAPQGGVAPADFGWDLAYTRALAAYPLPANEFLPIWLGRNPTRPVHARFASYAGEPIVGSALIEQPDAHAGDPLALWIIRTKDGASLCEFHPRFKDRPCEAAEPGRVDAFLHEAIDLRPTPAGAAEDIVIGNDAQGRPVVFNHVGFLSVWVDGRTLQRPISAVELLESLPGRGSTDATRSQLTLALARLTLKPAEYAAREQQLDAGGRYEALLEAARQGDTAGMSQLLNEGAPLVSPSESHDNVLAAAVGSGKTAAVDLLLQRGADIDAGEFAALKAAVETDDVAMLRHLLAKGARVDAAAGTPAARSLFESPLGYAVRRNHLEMARLLIERGADVNVRQARPIVIAASLSQNPAMLALVLQHGARVDQTSPDDGRHGARLPDGLRRQPGGPP